MANALDLAGFIRAAVDACRRYDADPLRASRYASVLEEIDLITGEHEGSLTLGAMEEIFAKYALPTVHLTEILRGL